MNNPSPSIPPKKRLIIPGAPIEEPSESEVGGAEEETAESIEEFTEQVETDEAPLEEAYEEAPEEAVESAEYEEEFAESFDAAGQDDAPVEVEADDFLMVDGQPMEEQGDEQAVQAAAPQKIAANEAKVVRRLLPRGAVHDDTAPVPRRFSSFQTSAVSVGTGQVPILEEAAHHPYAEHVQTAVHHAAPVVSNPTPGVAAPVQPSRTIYVPTKSGLPTWIFSLIGFLFGVLTVLILVKLGLMPPALGLTDQKALREAVKDERVRIIKILEEDGQDAEDWDNFVDEK